MEIILDPHRSYYCDSTAVQKFWETIPLVPPGPSGGESCDRTLGACAHRELVGVGLGGIFLTQTALFSLFAARGWL